MQKMLMIIGSAIGIVLVGALLYQIFVGDILSAMMPTVCAVVDRINQVIPLSGLTGKEVTLPGCG